MQGFWAPAHLHSQSAAAPDATCLAAVGPSLMAAWNMSWVKWGSCYSLMIQAWGHHHNYEKMGPMAILLWHKRITLLLL
jgi:hypothetical protein